MSWVCMPNMKSLPLMVITLWQRLDFRYVSQRSLSMSLGQTSSKKGEKDLSQGMFMCYMKDLPLMIQKL